MTIAIDGPFGHHPVNHLPPPPPVTFNNNISVVNLKSGGNAPCSCPVSWVTASPRVVPVCRSDIVACYVMAGACIIQHVKHGPNVGKLYRTGHLVMG